MRSRALLSVVSFYAALGLPFVAPGNVSATPLGGVLLSENVSIDDEAVTIHVHSSLADAGSIGERENVLYTLTGESVLFVRPDSDFGPFGGRIVNGLGSSRRQKLGGDRSANFEEAGRKNHISGRSAVIDQLGEKFGTTSVWVPSGLSRHVSRKIAMDFVKENIRALQFDQGALRNFHGLAREPSLSIGYSDQDDSKKSDECCGSSGDVVMPLINEPSAPPPKGDYFAGGAVFLGTMIFLLSFAELLDWHFARLDRR
ncbi:MAG TPA: hypothetical protein VMR17_20295 [Xanthobacteraceae bacterium]|nr:hypothetical protein [Xanthobacteraceae bacterium]